MRVEQEYKKTYEYNGNIKKNMAVLLYIYFLRQNNDIKKDNDNKVRKQNINQIQESKQ